LVAQVGVAAPEGSDDVACQGMERDRALVDVQFFVAEHWREILAASESWISAAARVNDHATVARTHTLTTTLNDHDDVNV
jgi:hypothetical protein